MREMTIDIRFTSPCLGAVRVQDGPVRFDRAGEDVTLPLSAWRRALELAADTVGIPRDRIEGIRVDPIIRRKPDTYQRYYDKAKFTEHEAYLTDTTIPITVLVPHTVSDALLMRLMTAVGKWWGISPYGWEKHGYGRFAVIKHTKNSGQDIACGEE